MALMLLNNTILESFGGLVQTSCVGIELVKVPTSGETAIIDPPLSTLQLICDRRTTSGLVIAKYDPMG